MSPLKIVGIVFIAVALHLSSLQAAEKNAETEIIGDVHPNKARDVREEAKYRYMRANEYEYAMMDDQLNDDVDKYEQDLEGMRIEDKKFTKLEQEYNGMRENLEMRIRNGELIIEGFPIISTKGRLASILDHMTGRVQY